MKATLRLLAWMGLKKPQDDRQPLKEQISGPRKTLESELHAILPLAEKGAGSVQQRAHRYTSNAELCQKGVKDGYTVEFGTGMGVDPQILLVILRAHTPKLYCPILPLLNCGPHDLAVF